MQSKTFFVPLFLVVFIAVLFSFRVRQNASIAARYKSEDGRFLAVAFLIDLVLFMALAVVGYGFIMFLFEFIPHLKTNYYDYRHATAFVFGVISENALPLLIDSLFAVFKKKTGEVVEKI